MNNAAFTSIKSWIKQQSQFVALYTQVLISVFFITLIAIFQWSTDHFWTKTQMPRLYQAAETQAQILAESQAAVLSATLELTPPDQLASALQETTQRMMIAEDPAIGDRFIRQFSLQVDYSVVNANDSSLDFFEGENHCDNCFHSDILLTNNDGDIMGVASFAISDGYYQSLIKEMKPRLFAESNMVLVLVIVIWFIVALIFHRLHTAKKHIEASDQAKTRFMANVTHELRTPLNAILGYTQLYKQNSELMRSYRQGIETIDRSADHLLLMINDILEFSRANEESIHLHITEVDVQKFLNTLVEMIRVRTQLKGLAFSYDFAESLPAIVCFDEKRLRQILLNLLGNAVKFTESGQIRFNVKLIPSITASRAHPTAKGTARLQFSVEDTGIGINQKQLKDIFIPFHQLDNAITRAEGTGLGLTISQRLLGLMNAKLHVSSKPNEGSVFRFTIEVPVVGTSSITPTNSDSLPADALFLLPEAAQLSQLKELATRHNVLGIRTLMEELESQNQYAEFLEKAKPFIQQYRFKQLIQWLQEQEEKQSR